MKAFTFVRPRTVDAAVAALAETGGAVHAGGVDLLDRMKEHVDEPSHLVTLLDVPGRDAIALEDDGGVHLGAGVTLAALAENDVVRRFLPSLAEAAGQAASPAIRHRATLGGNLMARRTRYEGALLLQALRAQLHFTGTAGRERIGVDAVWHGDLPSHAMLSDIEIDARALVAFDYERSLRPLMTQAVSVWREPAGLRLLLVLATEYLAPVNLSLAVPGLQPQQLAARAPAMARELLAQLPASFDDGQVTADYARHAGAALLARQLESLHV